MDGRRRVGRGRPDRHVPSATTTASSAAPAWPSSCPGIVHLGRGPLQLRPGQHPQGPARGRIGTKNRSMMALVGIGF
ncbi:MAG: hypothetical protein M0C28_38950 [Candidatus Moduliflexus flocculans]|nr:hypothetical protein [Candidatus Moduliflexus flocculans]